MSKVPYKYYDGIEKEAEKYLSMCSREQTEVPTVEGLALKLGVDDDTLVRWSKKYDKFKKVMTKLKMKQKTQLINDGLYGGKEVNQAMAIFLLKANHNMIETDRIIGDPKRPVGVIVLPKLNDNKLATPSRPAYRSIKED